MTLRAVRIVRIIRGIIQGMVWKIYGDSFCIRTFLCIIRHILRTDSRVDIIDAYLDCAHIGESTLEEGALTALPAYDPATLTDQLAANPPRANTERLASLDSLGFLQHLFQILFVSEWLRSWVCLLVNSTTGCFTRGLLFLTRTVFLVVLLWLTLIDYLGLFCLLLLLVLILTYVLMQSVFDDFLHLNLGLQPGLGLLWEFLLYEFAQILHLTGT